MEKDRHQTEKIKTTDKMVPENALRVPKYYLLYIIVLFVGKIWREMLTTDPGESPELHQASRQTISWDYRTFLHTRPAMFDRNIWTATVEKWRILEDATWFCDYTLGWCWHLQAAGPMVSYILSEAFLMIVL